MAADTTAAPNGAAGKTKRMNPYETDLDLIPEDDPFRLRSPHYGRYHPRADDFQPVYKDWFQHDPKVTEYWEETVKSLWTPENSLHVQGARQAYAAGSVLIRVDEEEVTGAAAEKFKCLNANELDAARKGEDILSELGVAVPKVYFCGTISGKNVTVESRLPGVSLDVAWRHLSEEQIELMKQQCRIVSERLSNGDTGPTQPSYVCSDLNSHPPSEAERGILFGDNGVHGGCSLIHNNMLLCNIVVDNHRIVGLTGWRGCGYFGFGRADKVHRQIRVPRLISEAESGIEVQNAQTWADLYIGLQGTAPVEPTAPAQPVKVEPSGTNLDKVPLTTDADVKPAAPHLDGTDTPEEHPTPKKIASLKNRGNSRASSSDRSSPANSTKAPAKRAAPGTKKGISKKTTTKKRKIDNQDNESVDSRRSLTPSSSRTSKTPGGKKQSSASLANSPAPEPKPKPKKKPGRKPKPKPADQERGQGQEEEEEDDTSSDELFCICRKPDNHTWMIGCDGGCEDWFHGKCVNMHSRDADLIERYICEFCSFIYLIFLTILTMARSELQRKGQRMDHLEADVSTNRVPQTSPFHQEKPQQVLFRRARAGIHAPKSPAS